MSANPPIDLEPRHLDELTPDENARAHAAATAEAKRRWGQDAQAVETGMPAERAAGQAAQVGIVRIVELVKKGFRPKSDKVFVALGRGRSWVAAFADADAVKRKIEEKLGESGIRKANETYARRLSKLHR